MISLGLDVDGVFADYLAGYHALGLPHDEAFTHIQSSHSFWRDLPPTPDAAALARVADSPQIHHVLFMTKRYGKYPQAQTADWLTAHGYTRPPAVLVVPADKTKAEIARVMGLSALIDDRMVSIQSLRACKGYLVDRPWNRDETVARGQRRVKTVDEALDWILGV